MKCLICKENVDVVVDDEGKPDVTNQWKCESCHSIYTFSNRNKIVDGVLCGHGSTIKYDWNTRTMQPVSTKENRL